MTLQQWLLIGLLAMVFAGLLWGRLRHDIVAVCALVTAVLTGLVPSGEAFAGFGHPAVVIVALVLIVSRGLTRAGALEWLAHRLLDSKRSLPAHIGLIGGAGALLSSLMNNVAALAMLMPLDLQAAHRAKRSPALSLMPLAFATILGGMVTLIGTPSNIVIATFREQALGSAYNMFDFTPVGLVVATCGVLFITFVGWRLIPAGPLQHDSGRELENLQGYVANARVPDDYPHIDQPVTNLDPVAEENGVQVLGIFRRGKRLPGRARRERIKKRDRLILEGSPEGIDAFAGATGLKLTQNEPAAGVLAESMSLIEVVVPEGARVAGRSALDLRLPYRRGVSLLGISRQGKRLVDQVNKTAIKAGDLLLLLGPEEELADTTDWLGCLPLAERGLDITERRKALPAMGLFAASIAIAASGLASLPVALAGVVIAYVVLGILPLSRLYETVEWPVVVLLGAMIPLGAAFESSGTAAAVADGLLWLAGDLPPLAILALLMFATMTLSDVLNNIATVLIAAPIGVDIAQRLGANPDAFLMAVAVGAACAFLSPIGHKNNTIIMGPGGYAFGDYWRMGLPLELIVMATALPAIAIFWPL